MVRVGAPEGGGQSAATPRDGCIEVEPEGAAGAVEGVTGTEALAVDPAWEAAVSAGVALRDPPPSADLPSDVPL